MGGEEIDERIALALSDTPEFRNKMAAEAEQERVNNLTDEQRAMEMMALFGLKK